MKILLIAILVCITSDTSVYAESLNGLFKDERFTENDAVLVVDQTGDTLYEWQANKRLIPASLTKLATAQLAIDKWGLDHRFVTDFYLVGNDLWVKGYGDPFLVSEELDLVVAALKRTRAVESIDSINIDDSYFEIAKVPGRTKVSDPYNAPLSAVAANFNTAKLRHVNGVIQSAEKQTPLTPTAKKVSGALKAKTERVNLVNADNAQSNFAELLLAKLTRSEPHKEKVSAPEINIGQSLPAQAQLVYRHRNSHTLEDVLVGTLEFSNNFMANQLFLKLADQTDAMSTAAKPMSVSFFRAQQFTNKQISKRYNWQDYTLVEGSGLSRENRLSASQIDDLLESLAPHKALLKRVDTKPFKANGAQVEVFAKTGTLDGVRAYAGYISFVGQNSTEKSAKNVRFVFMFNRSVPWRYREQMLERLVFELSSLSAT